MKTINFTTLIVIGHSFILCAYTMTSFVIGHIRQLRSTETKSGNIIGVYTYKEHKFLSTKETCKLIRTFVLPSIEGKKEG
jgi:hypothetical protein